MNQVFLRTVVVGVLTGSAVTVLRGEDWPMWGRDQTRNLVSPEKNPPLTWNVDTGKNIKWKAQLGSISRGNPVVAGGLIWVGTNNTQPRDPGFKLDASVLMCFRESDGKFLYQYVSPRLPGGQFNDWDRSSISCSPLIQGDRLWFTTNRCDTICLDIGPLKRGEGEPRLVWKVDMIKDLGVFPRVEGMGLAQPGSVGAYKDWIYVTTGNGVDDEHKLPAPQAPSLVCFHKDTGKLVWQDRSPGKNILEMQWASPLVVEINGRGQVIAGQGDGWVRSFDAVTGKPIWQCDTNPKSAQWKPSRGDRNYLLATPVFHEGRVYIANGRSPADGVTGPGRLLCIDPTREGDISLELEAGPGKGKPNPKSGVVWQYGGPVLPRPKVGRDLVFGPSVSTVAIHQGLLFAAEVDGFLHCLDAKTGKKYWDHDLRSECLGSPLIADGKVYLGDGDGDVFLFALGREKKLLGQIEMGRPVYSTPVFANGVLYLLTDATLFAIRETK